MEKCQQGRRKGRSVFPPLINASGKVACTGVRVHKSQHQWGWQWFPLLTKGTLGKYAGTISTDKPSNSLSAFWFLNKQRLNAVIKIRSASERPDGKREVVQKKSLAGNRESLLFLRWKKWFLTNVFNWMPGGRQPPPCKKWWLGLGQPAGCKRGGSARGGTKSILQGALLRFLPRPTSPSAAVGGLLGQRRPRKAVSVLAARVPGGPQSLPPFLTTQKQWHLSGLSGFSVYLSPPQWPHSIPHQEWLPQV